MENRVYNLTNVTALAPSFHYPIVEKNPITVGYVDTFGFVYGKSKENKDSPPKKKLIANFVSATTHRYLTALLMAPFSMILD